MKNRYSFLIKPINILIDILIINTVLYFIKDRDYVNINFMLYINFVWVLMSYYTGYYKVTRVTGGLKILNLIFGQFSIFILSFFAFFSLFREGVVINKQFVSLSFILSSLFFAKFLLFYLLKIYRGFGRNYRKVIMIGSDKAAKKLATFFALNENLGFRNVGFFSDKKSKANNYLGEIFNSYNYVLENNIDEIYCSLSSIDKETIKDIIWFAKTNHIEIKLIPEAKDIFSKNLSIEYYDTIPILKIKELPFELDEVRFIKRIFDIIFSIVVCIFVLSWLIPLLWIIIKIELKEQRLFFLQKRSGLKGKDFRCYKFSSMKANDEAHQKQAVKDDKRITKVGKFIRATSIDELPQFINVLKGEMSIVGPRPHMKKQSKGFEKKIDNYIKRNAVKPGITGLAQVRGYRGEITKKSDIDNRVRLDIFYIENWSFFLDIKIIFETLFNVLKGGDEKAY